MMMTKKTTSHHRNSKRNQLQTQEEIQNLLSYLASNNHQFKLHQSKLLRPRQALLKRNQHSWTTRTTMMMTKISNSQDQVRKQHPLLSPNLLPLPSKPHQPKPNQLRTSQQVIKRNLSLSLIRTRTTDSRTPDITKIQSTIMLRNLTNS